MPLILPSLQSGLIDIYSKGKKGNAFGGGVGHRTAKEYMKYVQQGINAGGQSFTAMPGVATLGGDLAEIYNNKSPASQLTAMKMAKAFDTCLQTFMSVFQNTIITAPGLPGLQTELIDLFGSPKGHTSLFCMAFGRALNNYTMSAVVIGVIPDTPGIPFQGPIS